MNTRKDNVYRAIGWGSAAIIGIIVWVAFVYWILGFVA